MIASSPKAPGFLFLCYPTFLASRDTYCTATNGAFIKYSGFKLVVIDAWCMVHFHHSSDMQFAISLTPKNSIDNMKFNIHTVGSSSNYYKRLSYNALSLQPITTTHLTMRGTVTQTLALHIAYGHCPISTLQHIIDDDFIAGRGIPEKLAPLPFQCQICDVADACKLRRGRLVDTTKLPFGVL